MSDPNCPDGRSTPASSSPNDPPVRRTVLSVDDHEAKRYVRGRILRAAGFDVIEAADGTEALRLAAAALPSLVILDVRLPDIDGFEVCRRLRANPLTASIPVLHVSAAGRLETDLPQALEHESDAYLREPVEPETLVATASALIRTREYRERLRRTEARYRGILEQAYEGICIVDTSGRTEFVNPRMAEMLGCSGPEELAGTDAFAFVPDEDRADIKARFAARLGGDSGDRYEVRLRRKDGSWIWTEVSGSTVRDKDGSAIGRLALFTDITQRKRAEAALIESQQRLVLAIDAAELGTWEIDLATSAVTASERAAEVFDLDRPEPALSQWMARMHPEDAGRVQRELEAAIRRPARFDSTFRVVRRSGAVAWIAAKGVPVIDDQGRTVRLLGVTQDITVRMEAEQARERERELLHSIIDNIPVMLCVYDPGMQRFELNRELQRVLGWTNGDANEGDFMARVYPDPAYRAEVAEYMRRLAPGWRELAATAKDGSKIPSEWANIRLSDDRIIGIGMDIRARKKAEQALRDSEERFRTMADNIAPLAWMADASGSIFWYNRRWFEYTGTTLEEMQGSGWQNVPHPDHVDRVVRRLRHSFETGEPWEDNFPLRGKGGEYRWFLSRALPIRDAEGGIVRWFGTHTDITELLEAEERLRQSERRYRGLFESMQEGFHLSEVIFDEAGKPVDWRFLAVNSAFEAMTGIPRDCAVGRTFREALPHFDHDAWVSRFAAVALTGAPLHVEDFDGGRHWEAVAYRAAANQFAVIFSDVTERKRAEDAMARQRQEYEALAENAPEVIARFDRELRHIYINNYGATVYGRAKEDILGKTNADLGFPERHVRESTRHFQKVFATGRQRTVEFEFDSPNLGHQFFSCLFVPEKDADGRVTSVLAITRDVTEQRRAEDAREDLVRSLSLAVQDGHRSRSELEAVLHAMQDGVAVFDLQGTIIFHNDAYTKTGRYSPEVRPLDLESLVRVLELRRPDGTVVPVEERPASRVLRGESFSDVELIGRRRDTGHEWHFSFSGEPVYEAGGRQILGVVVTRDVTDRKRAEERVRHSQKLESVGLLAGGIAHDFNNLLTGIMGNASMVLDEVGAGPAERIREVIGSAERAASLTRQLLAYSGKGQFIVRDIDISEAVNEIAALVEFSIPKSVQLSVNVQRRLPLVRMDPSQLQQVLMNLVINAGEAIGEGHPGRITVATSMRDVERHFIDAAGEDVAPGRYVLVEVTDTGSGIDGEKRAKIFDPFFTTKFTGRGLGLAAVAGIVRSQKGGITLESEPGRGSTFGVYIPASAGGVETAAKQPGGGDGETILVVDDEAAVRNFIAAVLRRRGYRVVTAADGREALAVFDREGGEVAAVVLDVIMPVMSGNDVLPKLKELRPTLKILLTSGYSESEARRLCAAYPGAAFIQKPYTAQQLGKAIQELLCARD